jgi:hypothetical protein
VKDPAFVLQFCIGLLGIEPPIWRRIQVPEDYTFWDLHVAIQDAMGWTDSHLHAFRVVGLEGDIGVPDKDKIDLPATKPGWKILIRDMFSDGRPLAAYEYDFGDSWVHEVPFERALPAKKGAKYPRCLDGARRCPPEDCGGAPGYKDFLRIIADPKDSEHDSMLKSVGGSFDPEMFDPGEVEFDDPRERFRLAFEDEGE